MCNLLVGNMVHHRRSRLHIVVLFLIFFTGAVGNGTDQAGNGDLHCPQQSKHGSHNENHIGQHISAGPADQLSHASADDTAGQSLHTSKIQLLDGSKAFCHPIVVNHKMENTAADNDKQDGADTAQRDPGLSAKGMDQKQIQKCRD